MAYLLSIIQCLFYFPYPSEVFSTARKGLPSSDQIKSMGLRDFLHRQYSRAEECSLNETFR